jgi:ubiquinone/menaquinone biosynthesis C-methylase UbiE
LRRLFFDPIPVIAPYVRPGMTVLEPGPGMGFFTLELARLAGPDGRVVAVDVQPRMIEGLKRRAANAGLLDRIDARLAKPDSLGVADLAADFALAFAVVHEVPAQEQFFAEVAAALKPGALLLMVEPKGHVKLPQFEKEIQTAAAAGFNSIDRPSIRGSHSVLLNKSRSAVPAD